MISDTDESTHKYMLHEMKIKAYRCLFCPNEDILGYSFSIHMHDRHNFQVEDLAMLATFLCDKLPMFQRLAFCKDCSIRMTRIYDMKPHRRYCSEHEPYTYKFGKFWRLNRDTADELYRLYGPEIAKLQNGEEFNRPLPIGYTQNPATGRGKKMDDQTEATLAKIKDLKLETDKDEVENFMTRHVRRSTNPVPHQFDDASNDDPWADVEDWDKDTDTGSDNSANTVIERRQQQPSAIGGVEASTGVDVDSAAAWETFDTDDDARGATTTVKNLMTSQQSTHDSRPIVRPPSISPPLSIGMMTLTRQQQDLTASTHPLQANISNPDILRTTPTYQPPQDSTPVRHSMDWTKYTPPEPEELNRLPTFMTHRKDYENLTAGLSYTPSITGELRHRKPTQRPCRQRWLFEDSLFPGQYSIKTPVSRVRLVVTKHWMNPTDMGSTVTIDVEKDEMAITLTDMTTRPPMNLLLASLASYVPGGEHELIPWDTARQISRVMVLET